MMRISLCAFVIHAGALLCVHCSQSKMTAQEDTPAWNLQGWDLVWHDEFDGASIDLSKWEYEVNANGGGNNEL